MSSPSIAASDRRNDRENESGRASGKLRLNGSHSQTSGIQAAKQRERKRKKKSAWAAQQFRAHCAVDPKTLVANTSAIESETQSGPKDLVVCCLFRLPDI